MFTFSSSRGLRAYHGASSEITLPTSWDGCRITTIDGWSYVNGITSITGDSILRLSLSAFMSCSTSLTTVSFKNCFSIGYSVFYGDSKLTSVITPNVTYIGDYAFLNCKSLSSVSFPKCTTLGAQVFWNCFSLNSVVIDTCEYLAGSAFGCYSTTSQALPLLTSWSMPMCYWIGSSNYFRGPSFHLRAFSMSGCYGNFASVTSIYVQQEKLAAFKASWLSLYSTKVYGEANDSDYIYPYEYLNSALTEVPTSKINCLGIGAYAFSAASLETTSITFPNASFIGTSAFCASSIMTTYASTLNFPSVTHIGFSSGASATPIFYSSRYGTLNFPALLSIPHYSIFGLYPKYRSVYLNAVKEIPGSFFSDCSNLTSINLDSCEVIYPSAFYACSSLTTLNLPACKVIYNDVFRSCKSLSKLNAPNLAYISMGAFYSASTIKSLNLPACKIMGGFDDAWNLTTVSLPNCSMVNGLKGTEFALNQVTASQRAYYSNGKGDISLISVDTTFRISSKFTETTATHIGGGLFSNTDGNITVSWLSTTANSIGPYCFYSCAFLSVAEIDNCTIIDTHAFRDCTSLAEVYTGNLTYVGQQAFYGCNLLSGIALSSCSYIGDLAFMNCYSMSWPSVLTSCKYIGSFAFCRCSSISTISLPNIAYIGSYAFSGCLSLKTIYLTGSKPLEAGVYLFSGCTALTSIYVPSSLYSTYIRSGHGLRTYSAKLVSV